MATPKSDVDASLAFYMLEYKVTPCQQQRPHDWQTCPFAHVGETARRRAPSTYKAQQCPEMKQKRTCPRGESCPFTHSLFEYWLHPDRFRTCMCEYAANCKRRICFFAHDPSEIRLPTSSTASEAGGVASGSATMLRDAISMPAARTQCIAGQCSHTADTSCAVHDQASCLPAFQGQVVPFVRLQPAPRTACTSMHSQGTGAGALLVPLRALSGDLQDLQQQQVQVQVQAPSFAVWDEASGHSSGSCLLTPSSSLQQLESSTSHVLEAMPSSASLTWDWDARSAYDACNASLTSNASSSFAFSGSATACGGAGSAWPSPGLAPAPPPPPPLSNGSAGSATSRDNLQQMLLLQELDHQLQLQQLLMALSAPISCAPMRPVAPMPLSAAASMPLLRAPLAAQPSVCHELAQGIGSTGWLETSALLQLLEGASLA